MILRWMALTLLLSSSVIPKSDGKRGYINNIQVSSGSSIITPHSLANAKTHEIPLEMLLRLNDVTDMGTFIENFLYSDLDNLTLPQISSALTPETFERKSNTVRLQQAVCKPELRTVSLKPKTDYQLYYHPSCIRIERCGGCCSHGLYTCTPVDSEIVNVQVVVAEYRGGGRLIPKEVKIVPVEKHTKCKCDCKVQPQNCTKPQIYNKSKCSCECSNTDAERKCNAEIKTKIWSKNRCQCLCREELECSSGSYFDFSSCRCELQEGRRKQPVGPWIVEN